MEFSREVPDTAEKYTHERTLLRLDKAGVNGLREIVRVNFTMADNAIEEHIHPDAIEICYYYKGTQIYSAGGTDYKINGGMIFVSYPNEVHSSGNRQQERDGQLFYMIIDTLNDTSSFLGLPGEDMPRLAAALNAMPRTFYVGSDIKSQYEDIFSIYLSKPFCWQTQLKCRAFGLLNELIARGRQQASPNVSLDIIKMLDYIEDHIYDLDRITVERMARHIHLSEPQFKARFLLETGLSPGKYINRRRMEIARQLLCDGLTVTSIAHRLNYSSSQHFSNCFHSYNGCSPSEWAKKQRRQNAQ